MNGGLKGKLIAGFMLVFLAGGMTGAFVASWHAHHFMMGEHDPSVMAARMKDHLKHELDLTPEQVTQISPIVEKMARQLEEVRGETGKRVHDAFDQGHKEMASFLTDQQKQKLAEMQRRHRGGPHMFHGGPPPPRP